MTENTFKLDGFDDEMKNLQNSNITIDHFEKTETQKISLNMYKDDWENLIKYRTFIVTDRKIDFSQTDAFIYGLTLLNKKHKVERGQDKVSLDRGRREVGEKRPKKSSSIDLPTEWLDFINDFLYHKKIIKGEVKYSRLDMISEMIELIKKNNKEILWT